MTNDEVSNYVDLFVKNNKGLNDVNFLVYKSIDNALPRVPKEVRDELNFQGAYYPTDKTVVIIADQHKNTSELQTTLNHEVYGHHGINHLTREEKKQLLEKIIEYPSDSTIGKFRDALLSKGYENLRDKPMMLAEETYAHLAELLPNSKEKFRGELNINEIKTGKDLMNVIRSVKGGIQSGELEHKITPERNDLQFKKDISLNKPEMAEKTHSNKTVLDFINSMKQDKQKEQSRGIER